MKEGIEQTKNIVVIGGGFGGVRIALSLSGKLPPNYRIILIDKKDYHLPQWMLYEMATVKMESEKRKGYDEVNHVAKIPYSEIFQHYPDITFIQGEVEDVFLDNKIVSYKPEVSGFEHRDFIKFEYAVLALGSETNFFNIKGMSERALGLKSFGDALNVRNSVVELFSRKKKTENVNIVIGGGGFSGVELATEMVNFIKRLSLGRGISPKRIRLSIVEAGPFVLFGSKSWLSRFAEKRIKNLGISLFLNSPIEKFEDGQISLGGGRVMPADLLIWTAGIRPNVLIEHLAGVPIVKGCLVVDEFLRIAGHPSVYGIGDNVYCFNKALQKPVPATSQRAVDQGRVVASNICRVIRGEQEKKYIPKNPAFIVPLGGKYAVADVYGVPLVGFLAWVLKMIVGLKYLVSILPWWKAFRLWLAGLAVYSRND